MSSGFLEESTYRALIREAREAKDNEEKLNKIIDAIEALKRYLEEKMKPDPFGGPSF